MTNASIIGFITQEKVAEFKKLLGDRFIAVADFPDGVPYAWQDKKLHLTGPNEPFYDGVFARFGIRNLENETEALENFNKGYSGRTSFCRRSFTAGILEHRHLGEVQ